MTAIGLCRVDSVSIKYQPLCGCRPTYSSLSVSVSAPGYVFCFPWKFVSALFPATCLVSSLSCVAVKRHHIVRAVSYRVRRSHSKSIKNNNDGKDIERQPCVTAQQERSNE